MINLQITLSDKTLPKKIDPGAFPKMLGESLFWFCPSCHKWQTTEVKLGETIVCPVCGGMPNWEKNPPTLAYQSRYQRVQDLCAEGSEWRIHYDEAERRYGDFIELTYIGIPTRTKDIGWKYFQGIWREVDKLGDYLLAAQDAPATDIPHTYNESGLQRRFYDKRRKYNVSLMSSLELRPVLDDDNVRFANQEAAEIISFHNIDSRPFYDTHPSDGLLDLIDDPLDRSIARDFSEGAKKRDIERKYGLSERQVRTRVAHIAEALKK